MVAPKVWVVVEPFEDNLMLGRDIAVSRESVVPDTAMIPNDSVTESLLADVKDQE